MDDYELEMTDDDCYAVGTAIRLARRILATPHVTPRQIVGLGNALYALERLPNITPGVVCTFGVSRRVGNEELSEMVYTTFTIDGSGFYIDRGGSTYDKSVGGDSYSLRGWAVEIGGYRCDGCNLADLEETIMEQMNLGAEISVEDESEIDYDELDG